MSSSASSNNTDEMIEQQMSTSSSSIPKRFKYDVFISFWDEDTRKNFVDQLYEALTQKGIETYIDDQKIKTGGRISNDLFKTIEDSKFYIIVFSKNYASSSWCLEELVKIMECRKMTGHTAFPIFYDVEPWEVRNQTGAVGKAFAKHENQEAVWKWRAALKTAADVAGFAIHENQEAVWNWREALKKAANLAGWGLKGTLDGREAKFIKNILQYISKELRSSNSVGMETQAWDIISSLEVGTDEVPMIGIKGMGGAGRTATARAVFDHLSAHFEATSFVENVREVSTTLGLTKLQEQVLSDVLNEKVTVNGVLDGIKRMRKRMCSKKVLLVLDDVDHIDQLQALAGAPEWFMPGSRILITTTDEQLLVAHGVKLIHHINLLSDKEAISLFSRYAFGRVLPSQGYEELSEKVVSYASGLPLTLKVLGSFLRDKDKVVWVDTIERLKRIPLEETLKEAADLAGRELKNAPDLDGDRDKFIQVIVDKMSLELHYGFDANSVNMVTRVKDVVTPATYFFQFIDMLSPVLNKLVEAMDLNPGVTFSFIVTCLLALIGVKSQNVTGFPFKTHPNAVKVPVISLLIYAFASLAKHAVSVARLHHTSVYAIIASLGRISSVCLFVTSLAILICI